MNNGAHAAEMAGFVVVVLAIVGSMVWLGRRSERNVDRADAAARDDRPDRPERPHQSDRPDRTAEARDTDVPIVPTAPSPVESRPTDGGPTGTQGAAGPATNGTVDRRSTSWTNGSGSVVSATRSPVAQAATVRGPLDGVQVVVAAPVGRSTPVVEGATTRATSPGPGRPAGVAEHLAPGWRPDPQRRTDLLRFWNGDRWTLHFAHRRDPGEGR
jgi:hypothetical protein